jgi:hypothetical protein
MPQYQGVWTLEAQAQALTNQQWVTDPNFKNTTLLLQADGTGSGSQNQTFLDSSTNNFFITRNGNTTQGSFSPFSQAPGYWSNYFDGSSYLTLTSGVAFGAGAFTIECWFKLNSITAYTQLIGNNLGWTIYFEGNNLVFYAGSNNSTWDIASNIVIMNTPSLNTWHHVALCRSGTSTKIFLNGSQVGSTYTDSNNYICLSGRPFLGALSDSTGTLYLNGYIDDARITKGYARYTATFTPPTAALSDTGPY